jgi:hypothetical protein
VGCTNSEEVGASWLCDLLFWGVVVGSGGLNDDLFHKMIQQENMN